MTIGVIIRIFLSTIDIGNVHSDWNVLSNGAVGSPPSRLEKEWDSFVSFQYFIDQKRRWSTSFESLSFNFITIPIKFLSFRSNWRLLLYSECVHCQRDIPQRWVFPWTGKVIGLMLNNVQWISYPSQLDNCLKLRVPSYCYIKEDHFFIFKWISTVYLESSPRRIILDELSL